MAKQGSAANKNMFIFSNFLGVGHFDLYLETLIKSYLQQQKRLVVVAPVGSHEKLFDQFSDEIALGRLHVYFFINVFSIDCLN